MIINSHNVAYTKSWTPKTFPDYYEKELQKSDSVIQKLHQLPDFSIHEKLSHLAQEITNLRNRCILWKEDNEKENWNTNDQTLYNECLILNEYHEKVKSELFYLNKKTMSLKEDSPNVFWAAEYLLKFFPEELSKLEGKLQKLKKLIDESQEVQKLFPKIHQEFTFLKNQFFRLQQKFTDWKNRREDPQDITHGTYDDPVEYYKAQGELSQSASLIVSQFQIIEQGMVYLQNLCYSPAECLCEKEKKENKQQSHLPNLPLPPQEKKDFSNEEVIQQIMEQFLAPSQKGIIDSLTSSSLMLSIDERMDQIVKEGEHVHLSRGMLCEKKIEIRKAQENTILHQLIPYYPPQEDFTLAILSLKPGTLLQDWIMINKLAQYGYNKIQLRLFYLNRDGSTGLAVCLSSLIKTLLPNLKVNVDYVRSFDQLKGQAFHSIYAFDFAKKSKEEQVLLCESLEYLTENAFCSVTIENDCFVYNKTLLPSFK